MRLEVCRNATKAQVLPIVTGCTLPQTTVNTDELNIYNTLPELNLEHWTVRHTPGCYSQWARDDDGDGIREVHTNRMEGLWTSLRNFLRRFRGIHKKYLQQYIKVFQWGWNLKRADDCFLRALMRPVTIFAP